MAADSSAPPQKFLELGLESPFERVAEAWSEPARGHAQPTTRIDSPAYEDVRTEALRAHATQIDPKSMFWFGLPPEVDTRVPHRDDVHPRPQHVGEDGAEDDLFAGCAPESALGSIPHRNGRRSDGKVATQEWLDEMSRLAEAQPERPGATARLQYVITGGPDGDVQYYWVVEDGQLLENRLGELDDAEVTLTETYEDAMAIQKGELDPNAAFMQGKLKVSGNMAMLMALLPVTGSPEYKALQAELLTLTEFA